MCLTPSHVEDVGPVACRNCQLCRENRVNDLIGRCIAEKNVSTATLAVTLTYGGDVPASATLLYSDVQKMFKRLRFDGHKVRYIVAGEYGSLKGRAHWHVVLFFRGKVPDLPLNKRVHWEYWPHGFVYTQRPDYGGFKYMMKYALKDTDKKEGFLMMSKKPPLGNDWFRDLAQHYVEHGLSPQSPAYSFRDVFNSKRERRTFWLQGRMREIYLETYLLLYRQRWGEDYPLSDFILEYEDRLCRESSEAELTAQDLDKRRAEHAASFALPSRPVELDSEYFLEWDFRLVTLSTGATVLKQGTETIWRSTDAKKIAWLRKNLETPPPHWGR